MWQIDIFSQNYRIYDMNKKLLEILGDRGGIDVLDNLLKNYQKIYGLKSTSYRESVTQDFFTYCKKGSYFIEVIAYNSKREIFVQRDLIRNKNSWELIGGWVNPGESFEEALDRVVTKETGSILVEAIPVEIIKNTYVCGHEHTAHTGIVYIGRLKEDSPILGNGMFTKTPEKCLTDKDKSIAAMGQKILKDKILQPPVNEVESYVKRPFGHFLHKGLVKPISYFFGSKIIQNKLMSQIKNTDKTVLDIACGDDLTVLKIQKMNKLVVANDICRDSLKKISSKDNDKKIIFSNQNMLDIKFDKKFDLVVIKNVMHHLGNPEEIDYFLNNLKSVGKKFVVIDIIDPKLNLLAKLWNKYYVWMLDDQGDYFINFEQFKKVFKLYYPSSKIDFSKIWTIKGPYMMAVVDNNF